MSPCALPLNATLLLSVVLDSGHYVIYSSIGLTAAFISIHIIIGIVHSGCGIHVMFRFMWREKISIITCPPKSQHCLYILHLFLSILPLQ